MTKYNKFFKSIISALCIFSTLIGSSFAATISLPGIVRFEDHRTVANAYYDTTPGNIGNPNNDRNLCQPFTSIDFSSCDDVGGGCCLGWIEPGEWITYDLSVTTTSVYSLRLRYAYPFGTPTGDQKSLKLYLDNTLYTTISVNPTGDWGIWKDAVVNVNVPIVAGPHFLNVTFASNWWRLNFIQFNAVLNRQNVPGLISAASFRGGRNGFDYFDTTAGNSGNPNNNLNGCRPFVDVDVQPSSDLRTDGNECSLGYLEPTEFVKYDLNFRNSSYYLVSIRYAYPAGTSSGDNKSVRLSIAGNVVATINLTPTNDWNRWKSSTAVRTTVPISAGPAEVSLLINNSWLRISYINFVLTA